MPSASGTWSLNPWTTREAPELFSPVVSCTLPAAAAAWAECLPSVRRYLVEASGHPMSWFVCDSPGLYLLSQHVSEGTG